MPVDHDGHLLSCVVSHVALIFRVICSVWHCRDAVNVSPFFSGQIVRISFDRPVPRVLPGFYQSGDGGKMVDAHYFLEIRVLLLKQRTRIISTAGVVLALMLSCWYMDSPGETYVIGAVGVVSLVLSLVLGYAAYRSAIMHPLGMACGVAWRLGAIWIVLAAFAEASITGGAFLTVRLFPILLVILIGIIGGGFTLGYLAGALRSGVYPVSRQTLITVLFSLLGIVGSVGSAIILAPEDKQQSIREDITELRELVEKLLTEQGNRTPDQ